MPALFLLDSVMQHKCDMGHMDRSSACPSLLLLDLGHENVTGVAGIALGHSRASSSLTRSDYDSATGVAQIGGGVDSAWF